MTAEHLSFQNGLYIEALADIAPNILAAACKQLIKDIDKFPVPSIIRKRALKIAEEHHASRALANPKPGVPENFLARVKRVTNHDADWLRAHHGLLEQTIGEHMDGHLTDAHLLEGIFRAERGLSAERQPGPAVARAAE